ncbi:MAG: GNAT family N-acetyltransferase [Sulfuritalea sp.]|nr:GNAT family N-acetyltransferase [Sulfuritalea sp.]
MIRPATLADLPRLIQLAKTMHAESRLAVLSFNPDKVLAMLTYCLQSGLLLVAERDGEIIGGFAGIIEEHWFSDDLVATDMGLFVEPGKRGGFAAAALVSAFLDWAEQRGAKMTDILINTGVRVEDTAKLLDRLGGGRVGLIYSWGSN